MTLNLLKLHSKEDTPKKWIWVYLPSKRLKKIYIKLIKDSSQKEISRYISNKLSCGYSTIKKHLIKLKEPKDNLWLPLPLIIELLKLSRLKYELIVSKSILYITSKNYKSQKVTAIKKLNINLAKLIGAHISDGHMRKEANGSYRIKISEGRKDAIERCSNWVEESFGIKPIIRFSKKDKTWNCWFNNKVIGRYFENIFKIKPGRKSHIAKEPQIIKNSDLSIRNAFALGVMTFDGGVKTSGIVAISSMSKELINDLARIFKLNNIEVNIGYNKKKKSWELESISGRDIKYLKRWKIFFEKGTWKRERLNFFIKEDRYSIEKLRYLFPKHHRGKIWIKDVWDVIRNIKSGKISNIQENMKIKELYVANTTLYKYLHLLEKSNLIYKEMEFHKGEKNGWREAVYSIN